MNEDIKIYLATMAFSKGLSYENLSYSDYLYDLKGEEKEEALEDIWDYVIMIQDNGVIWLKENFKNHNLFF